MRSIALALVLVAAAPKVRPADETVYEVQTAFYKEINARHGELNDEQAVPLLQRFWKIVDAHEGDDEGYNALQMIVGAAGQWKGEKADALWHDALDRLAEKFVDDGRLATVIAYANAPERLAKDFDAFCA
jgi:hypothetical protein